MQDTQHMQIMQHVQERQNRSSGLLTASQVMSRLGVDRSTVYRMAMDGRLPAVKVGRQWRFPADAIDHLLTVDGRVHAMNPDVIDTTEPIDITRARELIELTADRLGVMMVVTDMDGRPLLQPVNQCPWFADRATDRRMVEACASEWRVHADDPFLPPSFSVGVLGFECARAFVREGNRLVAMVLAGGIAPVGATTAGLHHLDAAGRQQVLDTLPRVAAALSRVTPRAMRVVEDAL